MDLPLRRLHGGWRCVQNRAGGAAREPVRRLRAQLGNLLIYVLPDAAVVTFALKHCGDTGVVAGVVLANAAIGFIQKGTAEIATVEFVRCRRLVLPSCEIGRGITPPRRSNWCPATLYCWRRAPRFLPISG